MSGIPTEAKPKPPTHEKLNAAYFNQSAPFGDERMSVAIGLNCDSILAARMEADGSAVPIDKGQRADGILVRRLVHDRTKNTHYVTQCFVPWANVRGLGYGPA